jgi:hypothetical protein
VLTSLDFLEAGRPWPPEDADTHKRLELYKDNRLLYESRAEEVYGRWVEVLRGNVEETHYVLNFHRRLSWLWADLIMGEPPDYRVGEADSAEQRVLEALVEENELDTAGQEVLVDVSRYGDGLFRLRVEDGRPVIEGQSPEYWFPVVSESNVRKTLYHVLAWALEREEGKEARRYLRCEVHEAGRVEHRLYRLDKNGRIEGRVVQPREVVSDWPERDVEPTGLDVPLIFHAPGARTTDRLHGSDDYTPIDSSMEYLMWLAAQRQAVIHKHSDPLVSGPPLDTLTTASGREVLASGSRYVEVAEDGDPRPEYHTFDGKLDASFRQTEELWKDVFIESETSPTAFAHSETGYAESGTSLRLRMFASLKKAERMRQRFDPVVKKLLKAAGELAGEDFSALAITWQDGLPEDKAEASRISAQDVESGITSRRAEMKRRYDYTDEQADAELEQMAEEGGAPESPLDAFLNTNGRGGGL